MVPDPFMEREVREIAPPDDMVRHRGDQRWAKGFDVARVGSWRETIDAGVSLDPAAFRSVVGERQELLEPGFASRHCGRKPNPVWATVKLNGSSRSRISSVMSQPRQTAVEMPSRFAGRWSGGCA